MTKIGIFQQVDWNVSTCSQNSYGISGHLNWEVYQPKHEKLSNQEGTLNREMEHVQLHEEV